MTQARSLACATALALTLGAAADALAAPMPINNCRRITRSGSYIVTRNLTANGDCLILAANSVTIDLDGFTITGNGTGIAVATDQLSSRRGYVVRNGLVDGFRRGVDLGNALDVLIEGINASACTEVGIAGGFTAVLKNNTVRGAGEVGIQAFEGSIVTGNMVTSTTKGTLNLGNGIVVTRGTVVSGNTSVFNDGHGIFAGCPSNILGNTAILNDDGNIETNPVTTGCNIEHNAAP
jgi:hypothetical protein